MSANVATFEDERPASTRHLLGGLIVVPDILRWPEDRIRVANVADDRVFRGPESRRSASRPRAHDGMQRRAA